MNGNQGHSNDNDDKRTTQGQTTNDGNRQNEPSHRQAEEILTLTEHSSLSFEVPHTTLNTVSSTVSADPNGDKSRHGDAKAKDPQVGAVEAHGNPDSYKGNLKSMPENRDYYIPDLSSNEDFGGTNRREGDASQMGMTPAEDLLNLSLSPTLTPPPMPTRMLSRPGAVSVEGMGMEQAPPIPGWPPGQTLEHSITTAVAVSDAELEYEVRRRILNEAVHASFVETAPSLDGTGESSGRNVWFARIIIGLLLTLVLLGILIGTVLVSEDNSNGKYTNNTLGGETGNATMVTQSPLTPAAPTPSPVITNAPSPATEEDRTPSPTTSKEHMLFELLAEASFDKGAALRKRGTPQRNAFMSLVENIDALMGITDTDTLSENHLLGQYVLLTLYNSAQGSQWTYQEGWYNFDAPVCLWYGVICLSINEPLSEFSGTRKLSYDIIAGISLPGNNLLGFIPPELGLLSDQLMSLDLSSNKLGGTIPSELGHLSLLQVLDLTENDFNGQLPEEICDISAEEVSVDCEDLVCSCCTPECHMPSSVPSKVPPTIPPAMAPIIMSQPTLAPALSPTPIPALTTPTQAPALKPTLPPTLAPTIILSIPELQQQPLLPILLPSPAPILPKTAPPTRPPIFPAPTRPPRPPPNTRTPFPTRPPLNNPQGGGQGSRPPPPPTLSPTRRPQNRPTNNAVDSGNNNNNNNNNNGGGGGGGRNNINDGGGGSNNINDGGGGRNNINDGSGSGGGNNNRGNGGNNRDGDIPAQENSVAAALEATPQANMDAQLLPDSSSSTGNVPAPADNGGNGGFRPVGDGGNTDGRNGGGDSPPRDLNQPFSEQSPGRMDGGGAGGGGNAGRGGGGAGGNKGHRRQQEQEQLDQ